MNSAEERRAYKEKLPRTRLQLQHTQNCRVLPDRKTLLEALPKGGVVAEVGVSKGDFSAEILARSEPRQLYLLDAWASARYAAEMQIVQERFRREIEAGTVIIDQGLSVETLAKFPEHHLDWVYVDTDHSFETTYAELSLCHSRVKQDGRIAGHDFCCGNVITPVPYGVIEACLKFCVDFGWQFELLTLEFSGNPSFSLMRL